MDLNYEAISNKEVAFSNTAINRLRKKAIYNLESLSDGQLLELLLTMVQEGQRKLLIQRLLDRFGSFAAVISAPVTDLLAVDGVSHCAAGALKTIRAGAVRLARAEVDYLPVLRSWDQLMSYLHILLARERVEQFRVLFLNSRLRLLADEMLGRGTINHTPVYPREVVKRALELRSTDLILVHNHPSGDPCPSSDDIAMTREVKHAAAALSLRLLDHVIIGNGGWLSMRNEGLI